jgi:hypothetical protein
MRVPLLKADEVNLNGYMYTEDAIKNAIEDYKKKIDEGQSFGELGYPDSDTSITDITDISRISHKVIEVEMNDKILFGKIEILDTAKGNDLKKIIDNVVFRPRSVGNVNHDGTVTIEKIISFDAILKDTDSYKDIL